MNEEKQALLMISIVASGFLVGNLIGVIVSFFIATFILTFFQLKRTGDADV